MLQNLIKWTHRISPQSAHFIILVKSWLCHFVHNLICLLFYFIADQTFAGHKRGQTETSKAVQRFLAIFGCDGLRCWGLWSDICLLYITYISQHIFVAVYWRLNNILLLVIKLLPGKNNWRPRYTHGEDLFCSSFRDKKMLEISLERYTVSEHPDSARTATRGV